MKALRQLVRVRVVRRRYAEASIEVVTNAVVVEVPAVILARVAGVLTPTQMGDTGGGLVPDPADPNVVYIMVRRALLRFDLTRNTFDRRSIKAWTVFAPSLATPELWYVGLGGIPCAI